LADTHRTDYAEEPGSVPKYQLAVLAASTLLTVSSALGAPAMWKVSDADSSIWLFGSVHLLPPDIAWRSAHFDKVMSKVERVYFETDVSPAAQMQIMPLSFELGFMRDGRLLSDVIDDDLTDRLREAANTYGMPMPMLLTMQPWMAATTISVGVLANTGYDPTLGVEQVLGASIPLERMGFLETPEEQIGFLAAGTVEEQIAMLEATLDTLDVMVDDIDEMVEAWLDGNPEELGEIFLDQMGGYDSGMVERIIDQRNHNWVEQIEAMLQRNESALLVVGAAHLVDDVSVVRLLEARGYTAERVQ
jgi:uncharacterized protein YbaP (TraB family)